MTSTTGLRWRVDGVGRDLVLVHGWALALDYWDTLVPLLLPQFRVLRFDRRGFGGSGGTPSLESDVTDLFSLMDRAGMQSAAVLGMSQGARVAVAAALAQPARVSALVLDGPPSLGSADPSAATTEQEVPLPQLLALWRDEGDMALQRAVAMLPLMSLVNATPAEKAALEHCIAGYRGADLAAAMRPPPMQPVKDLQLPVLIINGEQESAQRLQAGQQLAQQIAGCRRSVIPGAGHLAALDSPTGYAAMLENFLAGASTAQ